MGWNRGTSCKCESLPCPSPLCQHHYHFVYDMLQSNYLKKCSETCSLITPTVVLPEILPYEMFGNMYALTQKLSSNTYFKPLALRVVYHRTGGFVRHVIYNAHFIIIKNKPMSDLRSLIEELKACTTNNLLTNQDDVINPRRACTVLGLRALVCLSVCQLPHFLKLCATKRPSSDTNGCRVTLA